MLLEESAMVKRERCGRPRNRIRRDVRAMSVPAMAPQAEGTDVEKYSNASSELCCPQAQKTPSAATVFKDA